MFTGFNLSQRIMLIFDQFMVLDYLYVCVFVSSNWGPLTVYFNQYPLCPLKESVMLSWVPNRDKLWRLLVLGALDTGLRYAMLCRELRFVIICKYVMLCYAMWCMY